MTIQGVSMFNGYDQLMKPSPLNDQVGEKADKGDIIKADKTQPVNEFFVFQQQDLPIHLLYLWLDIHKTIFCDQGCALSIVKTRHKNVTAGEGKKYAKI